MRKEQHDSLEALLGHVQSTAASARAILLMIADTMPGGAPEHQQSLYGVADLMDRIESDALAAVAVTAERKVLRAAA
jgi:hypothetical protein